MKKLAAILLTVALAPLAVVPLAAADPTPNIGPSGCVVDGGLTPEQCDAKFIRDINSLGFDSWSVEDDGSPNRAMAIEAGHHIVNTLDAFIQAAAQQSGGSTDARGIADAFVKVVQKFMSDQNAPGHGQPVNVEQATQVVQFAIHWFGPPGMENTVMRAVQAVKGGGG